MNIQIKSAVIISMTLLKDRERTLLLPFSEENLSITTLPYLSLISLCYHPRHTVSNGFIISCGLSNRLKMWISHVVAIEYLITDASASYKSNHILQCRWSKTAIENKRRVSCQRYQGLKFEFRPNEV